MPLTFLPPPDDEEKRTREAARAAADRLLRPTAVQDDQACRFRREVFDELAREGLVAMTAPRRWGGRELSYRSYYGALEEISRASMATTVTIGVTNLIIGGLNAYGNDEQKERYLKPLCSGELLGAFSLSEPQSGSDAAGLRCAARRAPGGYRLTGTKVWCSTAGHADVYLLMARTGEHRTKGISAFVVPKETPGFRVGKHEKKLGLRTSSLAELVFEDAFVAEDQRIGAEGEGFGVALSQLDAGRITIGTAGLGVAIEALERAWRFLAAREKRHGVPFEEGTQQGLAEHWAHAQAVRGLIREAADARGRGENITAIAAQVKLLGSDLAMRVTSDCVHWMGPEGVLPEHEVERMMRDAKALQIVEGTNQIQRLVLAREMKERMSS